MAYGIGQPHIILKEAVHVVTLSYVVIRRTRTADLPAVRIKFFGKKFVVRVTFVHQMERV